MNQVAAILGISVPSFGARACAMKPSRIQKMDNGVRLFSCRDSLLLGNDKLRMTKDDDTASTLSTSESDLSFSGQMVRFADPLVTEVHTRPYTTPAEKFLLFYTASDYLDFRIDSYHSRYTERRNRLVRFADEVVTDVWSVPCLKRYSSDIYYSEAELQK